MTDFSVVRSWIETSIKGIDCWVEDHSNILTLGVRTEWPKSIEKHLDKYHPDDVGNHHFIYLGLYLDVDGCWALIEIGLAKDDQLDVGKLGVLGDPKFMDKLKTSIRAYYDRMRERYLNSIGVQFPEMPDA